MEIQNLGDCRPCHKTLHLHEDLGFFWVYSSRQVRSRGIDHSCLELLGVLRHRDGMQVHYKEKVLVLVLTCFGTKNDGLGFDFENGGFEVATYDERAAAKKRPCSYQHVCEVQRQDVLRAQLSGVLCCHSVLGCTNAIKTRLRSMLGRFPGESWPNF